MKLLIGSEDSVVLQAALEEYLMNASDMFVHLGDILVTAKRSRPIFALSRYQSSRFVLIRKGDNMLECHFLGNDDQPINIPTVEILFSILLGHLFDNMTSFNLII
ncbi:hypothetical protein PQ465_12085 [Sphingobacterium oryzagri]|uniref:Uncharacterized protein n=1 Tax=Sphingobacterium oryzagri TaxID=3025669 RepID=A0ABY7WFI5_9SPHI|nr:hypothetical protein [Sphingobacterium sp. KACC 22765]WDF67045.1 hypothetical protein PQ465_12085 [Sphingobacterium sp. KACC 22765]